MFDETQMKIINATMNLIIERGYSATTTKDIALKAGVNECTIFRKFDGKINVVISAMDLDEWNPKLFENEFKYIYDLENDLISFSKTYMKKITPRMVKISIGLRTPELYPYMADTILKVPKVFKDILVKYLTDMSEKGLISVDSTEATAMSFVASNFGFVFMKASFDDKISTLSTEDFIISNVKGFINGIKK